MENSAQESVAARREALARRQQAARSALRAPDAEAAPEAAPAPAGASEGGRDRTEAEPPPTAQDSAPSAPPCSGVVAVRRFTDLCDRAQAADKRGETATALSLYRELLQLRERLQSGRGPLLQTLFAVAQKVEKRVHELDGSTCSSAPTTGRSSSHSQEMVVIRPPTTAATMSRPASAAAVVQPSRVRTPPEPAGGPLPGLARWRSAPTVLRARCRRTGRSGRFHSHCRPGRALRNRRLNTSCDRVGPLLEK